MHYVPRKLGYTIEGAYVSIPQVGSEICRKQYGHVGEQIELFKCIVLNMYDLVYGYGRGDMT